MSLHLINSEISILTLKTAIILISAELLVISLLFTVYLKNTFSRLLYQYVFERYEYYIMEASLGRIERDSPLFRTTFFIRNILRVIILNKIMSVGGEARRGLVALYKDLGFEKRDVALLRSSRWYHRISAITALTITRSERLKNALADLILDHNLSVKVSLVKAISLFGGPELLEKIIQYMSEMPDWVNERLALTLMKTRKISYDRLIEIFNTSNARVKKYIVPLLFESEREQALWDLTNRFDDYDIETQISVVKSLYKTDSLEKITAFIDKIMRSDSWEMRAQLVKSLGFIRDEKVIRYLVDGLDDTNWFVRYNSAVSIARFGERGIAMLSEFANAKMGFKSDISRYILDLSRYGFINEEISG